jgi:hypothetical protein
MIARSISKNLNRAPDVLRRVGILWRDNVGKAIPGGKSGVEEGVHHTYNEWHLGDNAVHLHFLRKLAFQHPDRRFIHAVRPALIPQLAEVVEDLPNIELINFADRPKDSMNAWRNVGYLTPTGGFMDKHPLKIRWAKFHVDWFAHLAGQMGLKSPIAKADDLLFDYPAIQKKNAMSRPWSFLLINSTPSSNQFADYDGPAYFDPLIKALTASGHTVCCTQPTKTGIPCTADAGLSITGIGNLSLDVKYIIMISTGPSWPTFNIWNRLSVKLRVICLDKEQIGLSENTTQVRTRKEIMTLLKSRKLI